MTAILNITCISFLEFSCSYLFHIIKNRNLYNKLFWNSILSLRESYCYTTEREVLFDIIFHSPSPFFSVLMKETFCFLDEWILLLRIISRLAIWNRFWLQLIHTNKLLMLQKNLYFHSLYSPTDLNTSMHFDEKVYVHKISSAWQFEFIKHLAEWMAVLL